MLIFGHMGVTLGITKIYEKSNNIMNKRKSELQLDYRIVLIGALLPDIIDKPLVVLTANNPVGSAKSIAHSLFFVLFLLILGLISLLRYRKNGILLLALCSLIHQMLDGMWRYPKEFLWPIYGLRKIDSGKSVGTLAVSGAAKIKNVHEYISGINLIQLLSIPYFYVSEIIGGIIILCFFASLIYNKQIGNFIRTGRDHS